MKLQDLQEAKYYRTHPIIDFINSVGRDEIQSRTISPEEAPAIAQVITDKYGKPKGQLFNGYVYWTSSLEDTYCNIALSFEDDFAKVEVYKDLY